jgi:hypothetical protein
MVQSPRNASETDDKDVRLGFIHREFSDGRDWTYLEAGRSTRLGPKCIVFFCFSLDSVYLVRGYKLNRNVISLENRCIEVLN